MKLKPKHDVYLLLTFVLLLNVFSMLPVVRTQDMKNTNITFKPNVIPDLVVTDRPVDKPESFRFEWLGNKFDLELFFNATYKNVTKLFSLNDFEDDFNISVNYIVNKNESSVQFGWVIDNIENVSDYVHNAWFKIEDTQPFDYDEIELEESLIDSDELGEPIEPYNITRFHLPDNLSLSFEDLVHKGFIIGSQNKTATSVKGFSGKSSWNLDPITFSSGVMTLDDGTFSFWDLWNASYVNGWGVVENTTSGEGVSFVFGCRIIVGSTATTWLIDTEVTVVFNSTAVSAGAQYLIDVTAVHGNVRFGTLENEADKSTSEGVSIITLDTYTSTILIRVQASATANFYSCLLINEGSTEHRMALQTSDRVWNCILSGVFSQTIYDGYHTTLTNTNYALKYPIGTVTFEESLIASSSYGLYQRSGFGQGSTIKNSIFKDNTYLMRGFSMIEHNYLVNCDVDAWTFNWGGTCTANTYRQNSFDLTIYFKNGTQTENANVTITNDYLGSSDSWLTFANGSIPQQTYSYGHYNQTGGNIIYDYNPYNLTVTLDGYETYTDIINITRKEDLRITLTETTAPITYTSAILVGSLFLLIPVAVVLFFWRFEK